jgi:DnaJ-class molecular chaperone
MKKVVCGKCRGTKKYIGLGCMEKDCLECGKTGFVEQAEVVVPVVPVVEDVEVLGATDIAGLIDAVEASTCTELAFDDTVCEVKKRGRPAKPVC